MIKNNFYEINNKKIDKDIKIALISDIHFSSKIKDKILEEIITNIKYNKPNLICVLGDTLDSNNEANNNQVVNKIKKFFTRLSNIAPIVVGYGNHDVMYLETHKEIEGNKNILKDILKDIPNCTLLDNNSTNILGINFYEFNLPFNYYYNKNKKEDINILKEEFNKIKIKNNNDFNILLVHSPRLINKLENINFDLILSGHTHNGLFPTSLENKFKNNYGLISPRKILFPNYTRGKLNYDKSIHIISGGITKLSKTSRLFSNFNFLFKSHIEYIKIKK